MSFNYNKLRGRIVEKFGTLDAFASAINLSNHTVSKYLNNKIPWKQTNIDAAVRALNIPPEEISAYFFTPNVQSIECGGDGNETA
jgi:transcriptional regulator with XRE-family HTH domain